MIISRMANRIKYYMFVFRWRKLNQHNSTRPVSTFPLDAVEVGRYTYGRLDIETYGTPGVYLKIGSFCSIARDVRFLLDGEHDYTRVSTFPFRVHILNQKSEALSKGPIVVEDDVWIGERSMILSGVTIGQGAVIAAGSIVYKNVPPYAIFAAGRVIKYRFTDEVIRGLLKLDYSSFDKPEELLSHVDDMYLDPDVFLGSEFYKKHSKGEKR